MNKAEEQISDLEDKTWKSPNKDRRQKDKLNRDKKKKESNIRDIWDNIKWSNYK